MGSEFQNKFWSNLKEMAETLDNNKGGIPVPLLEGSGANTPDATYEINEKKAEILGSFLKQWSVYLAPVYDILTPLYMIPGWFAKTFYYFSHALESVFEKVFSLFGFFNLLQGDSFIADVYSWLRAFGVIVFAFFVVSRIVMSWMGTPFKYKEFINHMIIVTAAVAVLPQALISFSTLWADASNNLLKTSNEREAKKNISMSAQPLRDNVTDIMQLVENNFDISKLGRSDGDNGYIDTSKLGKGVELNKIDDSNIYSLDFTSSYGATDKDTLKYFAENSDKNVNYYGLPAIFHSALVSFEYDENGNPKLVDVKGYKTKAFWEVENNLKIKSYLRYRVNWLALYIQQIMLILLLIGLLLNTIQTIFRVVLSTVVAPIVGYTAVEDSSKFLELLQSIFAGIAGIWFEILVVKYGMWFLTTAGSVKIEGFSTFFEGLGFFEKSIASIALYIGVFIAASQGSRAIENWLGIPTGAKTGMMQAAGAAYAANRIRRAGTNAVLGKKNSQGQRQGGLIGNKNSALSKARDFGGKALKGSGRAIVGSGRAVTGGIGVAAGMGQGAKSGGALSAFGNTVANSTYRPAFSKAKQGIDYVAKGAKDNFDKGKEQGARFTTNFRKEEKEANLSEAQDLQPTKRPPGRSFSESNKSSRRRPKPSPKQINGRNSKNKNL
ncbi:hypothetical protein MK370_09070 [Streptococcus sanguinis]|uniref:pLS20_p028 family conjugation system transmembrane protein n=1 Tax=Streptococcus sanguinis TaxID=1305 RepID=UPI002284754E|nr:hypothetical protein [Streptococcus sanguinis]MCY7041679.1 hypothetical protein [Streptococcus sanguinis]